MEENNVDTNAKELSDQQRHLMEIGKRVQDAMRISNQASVQKIISNNKSS